MSAQFSRTQLELKCNTRASSSFNPWRYTASLSNILNITFILTFRNKLYLAFNLFCQLLITSPLLRLTDQRRPGTHMRKEKKKKILVSLFSLYRKGDCKPSGTTGASQQKELRKDSYGV